MATQRDVAQALQAQGIDVFNLAVESTGNALSLRGTVKSEADKKKAEQAVQGVDKELSIANFLEVQSGGGGQTYVVQSGDNLRKIATRFYGDEMKWHTIRDANRDVLPDPDKIQQGMKLVIP